MAELRIGTSGYDYPDWKGPFYPPDLDRADFLGFYSGRFSTVELNFSYYRMPTAAQLAGMLKRSGSGLDFSIKAHESLTHRVDPAAWREAALEYARSLEPLAEAGRLTAVLFQFPFSFHYTPENRRHLDRLLAELAELPRVVEFRNAEWLNIRVFDALRERGVGFCAVDAPQLKGLPASVDIVTSPLAYIRFHGRNEQNWWGSDAAACFDYRYSDDELRSWVGRIASMLKAAQSMRVYFNNHPRGQSAMNAAMLRELLGAEGMHPL